MNAQTNISPYRHATRSALVQQALILVLAGMILDGGDVLQICLAALLAFWAGVAFIRWRRPQAPTKLDLVLIEGGYLAICVVTFFAVHFAWYLRGYGGLR
jgi:hypothetical protein